MSRTTRRTLAIAFPLLLLAALAAPSPARAQLLGTLEVDVPFDFVVADTTFPAGSYLIDPASSEEAATLRLSSADGRHETLFQTEDVAAVDAPADTHLVFDEVGGKHFLSQVWVAGERNGRQAIKSRREEELLGEGQSFHTRHVLARHRQAQPERP